MNFYLNVFFWFSFYFLIKKFVKKSNFLFFRDWVTDEDCAFFSMNLISYFHAFIITFECMKCLYFKESYTLTNPLDQNDKDIAYFTLSYFTYDL